MVAFVVIHTTFSSSAGFLTIEEAGGQTLEQTLTSAISRAIRETFNSRSSIQVRLLFYEYFIDLVFTL